MDRALSEQDGKLKIRPELMLEESLYHCIIGDKLMLAYSDSQKMLHCYEVEDPQIIGAVRACASYEDEVQLLERIGAGDMNKVIKQATKDTPLMSASNDATDIYTEYSERQDGAPSDTPPQSTQAPDPAPQPDSGSQYGSAPDTAPSSQPASDSSSDGADSQRSGETHDRSTILIGIKPIMTYVTATLTQLATSPKITIKSRGKRITQAVDVSQMIVKRMNTVGYQISDVRIASDSFTGDDGRDRKISTMEIDITKV